MADTKIKVEEQKQLQDLITNMNATVYRLNLLCNRFEQDKDTLLKEGLDVKEVVKSLQKEVEIFAKVRAEVREALSQEVGRASRAIAQAAQDGIRESLRDSVENIACRLDRTVSRAEKKIDYFYEIDAKAFVKMCSILIVLPVVTGILIAKLLMSEPIMKFNKSTCEVYQRQCRYVH